MDDTTKSLVKALLIVFVGIPAVAAVGSFVIRGALTMIVNAQAKKEFNQKIKDGLKNGTIVKGDDGNYYEVVINGNV